MSLPPQNKPPSPSKTVATTKRLEPKKGCTPTIVGIGASAGGLEALEQFFRNVPEACGLAFVVVQHLDPEHISMMPELLQRVTTMKVIQVRDGTPAQSDCVYVIPPNKDLSLLHGVLHLLEPSVPRGLRLPIDFFFHSLAVDQRERSVGIILSGMVSDGTLGLKAIKAEAGMVLVQDPATAKFDGMPTSAIAAGLADIVAPPGALPARLLECLRHTPKIVSADAPEEDAAQNQLEKAIILLRGQTGHDFSLYKRSTLYRRIERRMGLHRISKIAYYVRYLRENPQEIELLFKELLIGVTNFFRDPATWDQLRDEVLPSLLASRTAGRTLRAWVPGCSTGEEAYSLAIVFQEALEQLKPRQNFSLQIFATDLDQDAVEQARLGRFRENIAAHMTPERLARFFHREDKGYRVVNEIREMVIFAPQNLVMDPPFTKLDLLTCRNLLIYFEPALQKKLLPLFHYSLNPSGVLLLGSAESGTGFTDLFTPFPGKSRLFLRRESALKHHDLIDFPSRFMATPLDPFKPTDRQPRSTGTNFQLLAEKLLLGRFAPVAVLVNDSGDILYISGRTGPYLEPAAGKANWNVFVMAREGLSFELTKAFQQARRQSEPVTVRQLSVSTNAGPHRLDLTVEILAEPAELRGLAMIVFTPNAEPIAQGKSRTKKPGRQNAQVTELEQQLQRAREEVQSIREVMQTSQEEFKSMNEELQSTNEELQSTNEELTTSKEEMQSLNEELQTVNTELQIKVDELNATSDDMKNLLNSTQIATVFLDSTLRVRRFTEQATKLFNFIPSDIGRPVTDLTSDLIYKELVNDAREVVRSLVTVEKNLSTHDGRWVAMRLMPYRTMDDRINGVVITFTDISVAKKLEAELRARPEGKT